MPNREERSTTRRAKRALAKGKASTTAAGEFVREEIHHVRRGKHGARSAKQTIAIGLSKARRAGVPVPRRGKKGAQRTTSRRKNRTSRTSQTSKKRSRTALHALKRERKTSASKRTLSKQARRAGARRRARATGRYKMRRHMNHRRHTRRRAHG
jgi:hypothetical protein